mgnify:CR=1 FL=1
MSKNISEILSNSLDSVDKFKFQEKLALLLDTTDLSESGISKALEGVDKDKFIQLNVIHSTKRENQTIIGLTAEGRVFKGVVAYPNQNANYYNWIELNLPEQLQ